MMHAPKNRLSRSTIDNAKIDRVALLWPASSIFLLQLRLSTRRRQASTCRGPTWCHRPSRCHGPTQHHRTSLRRCPTHIWKIKTRKKNTNKERDTGMERTSGRQSMNTGWIEKKYGKVQAENKLVEILPLYYWHRYMYRYR